MIFEGGMGGGGVAVGVQYGTDKDKQKKGGPIRRLNAIPDPCDRPLVDRGSLRNLEAWERKRIGIMRMFRTILSEIVLGKKIKK